MNSIKMFIEDFVDNFKDMLYCIFTELIPGIIGIVLVFGFLLFIGFIINYIINLF